MTAGAGGYRITCGIRHYGGNRPRMPSPADPAAVAGSRPDTATTRDQRPAREQRRPDIADAGAGLVVR
ncbi:hypothetical protein PJI17_09610 [Mycobacterium kansasii]